MSECEREVDAAQALLGSTKVHYDTLVSRMTEELHRYQKERGKEMREVLGAFAAMRGRYGAEDASRYSSLLTSLKGTGVMQG